jgi:hypothetical protein
MMRLDEKIRFKNGDGLTITGILSKPDKDTTTCIILCHGFRSNKDESGNLTALASQLTASGFAVFRFDFRAHGESEGDSIDLTIHGEEMDIEAAFNLMINKGYKRFGVCAASFAGGAISFFAPKHQESVKALALLYPHLAFKGYLERVWLSDEQRHKLDNEGFLLYKDFKVGKALVDEMSRIRPIDELKKLRIPVLFVHGDADTSVPYAESAKYAKELNARLVTIHGGKHGFPEDKHLREAISAIATFFSDKLGSTDKSKLT